MLLSKVVEPQASSLGDEIAVRQILGTNTGTTACLVPPTGRRVARYQHTPKEAASQPPKQEKQEEIEEENEEEQEQD